MTEGRLQTYPGSKTPVQRFAGPVLAADWSILDAVGLPAAWARLDSGEDISLYTIGQLALALNRKAGTIRMWEREGIIPVALWSRAIRDDGKDVVDPRGTRRYYSTKQVIGMRRIADEEGILAHTARPIRSTNFIVRVQQLFAEES